MASRRAEECHDIVAHGGTVDDALACTLAVSDDDEYDRMIEGVEEGAYDKMMAQQRQQQARKGKGKERAQPCMKNYWSREPNYPSDLVKGVRKSARATARAMVAEGAQCVADLWADPQFVDAFVECPHLSFSTRRALHRTTAGLRRKMREFFKRPTLVLREEDCTNGNAAFLFGEWPDTMPNDWLPGPLLCWNPGVVLRFEPPNGCDEGAIPSVAINDWMAAHQLSPGEPLRQGAKHFRVPSNGLSEVAAFFLGRAWATLSDGVIQLVDASRTWEEQFTLGDPAASRVRLTSLRQHRVPIGTIRTDHMLRSEFAFLAGAYYANTRRWLRDVCRVQREGVRVFSLDLSHRFLDEAGAEALARALRPDPPPPKPLRSFPKKKLPKAKVLLKPEGQGLLKLNLSHSWNPTYPPGFLNARAGLLAPILRGKVATNRLRDLNLSGNLMGVEGMVALERACTTGNFKPMALVKLRLRHVRLTHDAMFYFAPLLSCGSALRRLELLDIGANPFNDESLNELKKQSLGMPCLSNLKLDGCNSLTTRTLQDTAYEIKSSNLWPKIRRVRLYSGEYPMATDHQHKADLMMRSAVACVRAQNKWARIHAMPAHQAQSCSFYSSDEEAASSDSYMSYGPGSDED